MTNTFFDSSKGDVVVGYAKDGDTAHAGGGRANALQMKFGTLGVHRYTVVASSGDSAALPLAVPGTWLVAINDGANPMKIYATPGSTDTIDGIAAATGVTLTNGNRAIFFSPAVGEWISLTGVASN